MKKNRSLIIIVSVIAFMISFSSYVIAKGPKPKVIRVTPKKGQQGATLDVIVRGRNFVCLSEETPTYTNNVQAILEANCTTSCHSPSGTTPQEPYLNTYKRAYEERNKIVEATDEGGSMSGILTPEDKATIDAWVD